MSDVNGEDPKDPLKKESYDLKVTVRQWDGKKFLKPIPNQPAFLAERKGKTVLYLLNPAGNTRTPKGSEITIGETVYVSEKGEDRGGAYYESIVTPKPKGK